MTNPAAQRYLLRFLPSMGIYIALLFLAQWMMGSFDLDGPALVAVALLPAVPLIVVIWAIGRFIVEQQDEYLRMRQVRQTLIATGFMLVVTTVWGILEAGNVVPHLELYWAFVLWCFGLFFEPVIFWISSRKDAE